MKHTVLSYFRWVDNIWLFAPDTRTLQTMTADPTRRPPHDLWMHWKTASLQIMCAAHVPRRDRNVVTARALEGHRLVFDPCCSMKVLGSWCDDGGGRPTANTRGLLRDNMLPIAGRAKAFGTACAGSTLHGLETLHVDEVGVRKLKVWEGRWLRKMRHFGKGNWETDQHTMKRTEDALNTIDAKNELKRMHSKSRRHPGCA